MNIHLCRVALRPRGPLEVFDLTFAVLRAHGGVVARLTAIIVVPLAVACSVGCVWTSGHVAWLLTPVVCAPAVGLPFTLLAGRLLFADEWTVGQVIRELVSRPSPMFAVLGWTLLLELIAVATCGAALVVTRPLSAFLAESALLERTRSGRLFQRAARLALLHPPGAIAVVGGWFVVTAWGMVAGEAVGHAIVTHLLQLGRPFGQATDGVVTPYLLVGGLVVQPLFAMYRVLQFIDTRTRLDGWDLQIGLRAARLGR